jgi:hypothetical protein
MTDPGVEGMAGPPQDWSAATAGKVHRASELLNAQERAGVHRILPVLSALRPLLPGQGLRRGATIAVRTARPVEPSRHSRPRPQLRGTSPETSRRVPAEAARGVAAEAARGARPEVAYGTVAEAARGARPEVAYGAAAEAARGVAPEARPAVREAWPAGDQAPRPGQEARPVAGSTAGSIGGPTAGSVGGSSAGRRSGGRSSGRQGAGLALATQAKVAQRDELPSGPVVATSLMLALLAEASQAGSWCAVVGVPTLGAAAAAELGIALDRLVLVPYPGPEWVNVVAALVDGVDVVVAAPPGPVAAQVASRLTARARQRGCVLVPLIPWSGSSAPADGRWAGTDVVLESVRGAWEGLGQGQGRLRRRKVTISAQGRGAAARRKQVQIWLPATPDGWVGAELAGTAERPALTVIDGAGEGDGIGAAWVAAGTGVDEAV